MTAVVVVGLALPAFWFGMWVPVLAAVSRSYGLPRVAIIALSPLGPVGALLGVVAGVARGRQRR